MLILMRVLALMIVYRLARPSLGGVPLSSRIVGLALLDTMVAGNIRVAIMEAVVTEETAFPMIGLAWSLTKSLVLAALVLGSQRVVRSAWASPFAAAIVTAAMLLAIDPIGRTCLAPFTHLQRPEIHAEPYGAWVLSWSYAAFVETVAASWAIARLVAPQLSPRSALAMVQFVVLILLLRGTLVMQLLFPWFMQSGFAGASLSTSQFFLQDWTMAVLIWLLWRSDPAGAASRGR